MGDSLPGMEAFRFFFYINKKTASGGHEKHGMPGMEAFRFLYK